MLTSSERRLGRFILGRPLGASSLAIVYEARDAETGQRVAVKLLSRYLTQDPSLVEEFFELTRRVAALRHPNIVNLVEIGVEGQPWVATEYLAGGSLKERMGVPLGLDDASHVLAQIGAALDAAHAAGFIHGDIKPANVLATGAGAYKLGDFGMAGLARGVHPLVRASCSTPSPPYMAPEQAQELTVDHRSDIYSLGVLAYHLTTGSVPFSGADPITVWAKGLKGPPPDPATLNPLIPASVTGTLLAAMAPSPLNRYPSCGAFAGAFRTALLEQPAGATAATVQPAPLPTPIEVRPAAESPILARSRALGHGRMLRSIAWIGGAWRTALVVALAVLTGALGALFIDRATVPPPPSSLVTSEPSSGQWAMYQRDPSHAGYAAGPSPLFEGKVRWGFIMSESLLASPSVVGDVVYLATGDRRIVAIGVADGLLRWEHPVTGPVDGTPALAGELLYAGLRDGKVIALNRGTGSVAWSYDTGGAIVASLLVYQGAVYVGNSRGMLEAIDAATGRPLWRFATERWITAAPAVTEAGVLVVGSGDGSIYFLDPRTGRLRLTYRAAMSVDAPPVTSGEVAYAAFDNGVVVAMDARQRQRLLDWQVFRAKVQLFLWAMLSKPPMQRGHLWGSSVSRSSASAPAVTESLLLVSTRDGKVHAIDRATGKRRWSFATQTASALPPIVIGDTAYVSSTSGSVLGLRADTGEAVWRWDAPRTLSPSTPPVVAGDTLYVGASEERPRVILLRIAQDGTPLPVDNDGAPDHWYYRYSASICRPEETGPVGPFRTQQDASAAASLNSRGCSILYAIQ